MSNQLNRVIFIGALVATAAGIGAGVAKHFSNKDQAERTRIQGFSRLKDALNTSEYTIASRSVSKPEKTATLYKTMDVFVSPSADPEKDPPKGHTTHAIIDGVVGDPIPVDVVPCTKADKDTGASCKELATTSKQALDALKKINDDALEAFREGEQVTAIYVPAAIVNALPAPEGLTIRPIEIVPSGSTVEEKVPEAKVLRRFTATIPVAPANKPAPK